MPLVFQEALLPPGEWGLWRIEETEAELTDYTPLHPRERTQLDTLKGDAHRREFLAARLLLHHMSGRSERGELVKDDCGKPHLEDSSFHVSISHTRGLAAAVAHPLPCGIDVQRIVPHIHRLAHKFVNAHERAALSPDNELVELHLLWSAKEALYKAYGRRKLDFCRDLHVNLSGARARVQCETRDRSSTSKPALVQTYRLKTRVWREFVLAAVVREGNP